MKIGIDVDGVLNNIEKFQLDYGKKFFKSKYNMDIVNENGYGIKEIFDCTDEQEIEFWIKYSVKFNLLGKPKDGMVELIKNLKKEGNEIHIITSRTKTLEDNAIGKIMRGFIETWLKVNHIPYDSITYCSTDNSSIDKANVCKEKEIDLMIEDYYENAKEISKYSKVALIPTKNNKNFDVAGYNNIKRVNSSNEIYKFVGEIKNPDSSFKILNYKEKQALSTKERIEYYQKLKNYYKNLPYDFKKAKKDDQNCLKVISSMQPFIKFLYNPQNMNPEELNLKEGVIFASNHLHSLDPILIMNKDKIPFSLLAKEQLNKSILGCFFRYIGSIFSDNDDEFSRKNSMDRMIQKVLHGGNLMMFPEGTRNDEKRDAINKITHKMLKDFRYGTVTVAQITGAPIIPYAINKEYKFRKNSLIANMGEPIYIGPEDDLDEALERLRVAIATLLWELMEYQETNDEIRQKKAM